MINVKIELEFHLFADDRLDDSLLDAPPLEHGIFLPQDVATIRKYRHHTMTIECDARTTLEKVFNTIVAETENEGRSYVDEWSFFFVNAPERFRIGNPSAPFLDIAKKYLNLDKFQKVLAEIYVSFNAGTIYKEDGIRYYMHSREAGKHSLPHVHIEDAQHKYQASISLQNGELLAGVFPLRLLKKVQQKIEDDNDYFMNCWHQCTDGLEPDINHHYGYIDY